MFLLSADRKDAFTSDSTNISLVKVDKVEEVTAGIISEEDKLKENMLSLLKEMPFEVIQ